MTIYRNVNTGVLWTLEEIQEALKQFEHESTLSFDEVMQDYESVMDITNNGILTDGVNFFVNFSDGKNASIPIKETDYAHLLEGTETEFQDGILDIDNDIDLWELLFERKEG